MAAAIRKPTHLTPSELGTQEYWDKLYTLEITNHTQDPTDEGTIWFDDCLAEDKAVEFLRSPRLGLDRRTASFLDLGTGNGHFLFRLREGEEEEEEDSEEDEEEQDNVESREGFNGFKGRMMGVDYSQKSIEFARRIADSKELGSAQDGFVEFEHWDLLNDSAESVMSGDNISGWDVVLDKGTFDAISLSEEKDAAGVRICENYKDKVVPLVKKGGRFFVTSCNWTEDELKGWFDGGEFEYEDCVKYKSFSFGGKKGQSISSLCFRRIG